MQSGGGVNSENYTELIDKVNELSDEKANTKYVDSELQELKNQIGDISTTEVSETEPTEENVNLWIDPSSNNTFNLPEINDEEISTADTWSSNKINEEFDKLSQEIVNYLPKNQGASNVGKILVVGTDGNLVLTDMPEGGASGDVTGVLDESNNILLSGNLADGTYTLKFEMEDGTYVDVGTVTVGKEEVVIVNQIPLSTDASGNPFNNGQGWKTGYRLSGSSGAETAQDNTEVTGFIPINADSTVYMKGIIDDGTHVVGTYDSSYVTLKTLSLGNIGTFDGNVVAMPISGNAWNNIGLDKTKVAFMRICANEITSESIITINQPIS